MAEEDLIYINGINAITGGYGIPPMSETDFANTIAGDDDSPAPKKPDNFSELDTKRLQAIQRRDIPKLNSRLAELETRLKRTTDKTERNAIETELQAVKDHIAGIGDFGLKEGVDPDRLALTGWGVIFPESMPSEQVELIQTYLKPLLDLRRTQIKTGSIIIKNQAGEEEEGERGPFKIFAGQNGYIAGNRYNKFLSKNRGTVSGPVDPAKGVPYYLLIIGSPVQIPYKFQYQLDVQYAVGRIYFDEVANYGRYAQSVVAVETGQVKRPHQIDFFNVANRDDPATRLSSEHLVKPLYQTFIEQDKNTPWQHTLHEDKQAKKEALSQLLNGGNPPALLFTASHGVEFPKGHSHQLNHQGALLCQDWPGPRRWRKAIPEKYYFSADDLSPETDLTGMIAFFFACYGAGTPQYDEFDRLKLKEGESATTIADQPFIANLPKTMLSRGALAVVGHVEQAWGYSFYHADGGRQITVFESTIQRLMNGLPLGSAVEYFNERYAELATDLTSMLDDISWGETYDSRELVTSWTAHNDARNYIIIGDPAVRLAVFEVEDTSGNSATIPNPLPTPPTTAVPQKEEVAKGDLNHTFGISASPSDTMSGKPLASINDEDWANTPDSIKTLLQSYITMIDELKTTLNDWKP